MASKRGRTATERPDAPDAPPSKSRRKRDALALRSLGEALADLPVSARERLPLDPALAEAIEGARTLVRGARQRQLGYVARLLRERDVGPLRAALEGVREGAAESAAHHHRLERWRERLLEEGDAALEALLVEQPDVDRARIRGLVREARRERAEERPPRAYRELYRVLRDATEAG